MEVKDTSLEMPPRAARRVALRNLIFVAVAVGTAYFVTISVGVDRLGEIVETAGIWGPLAVIALKITTIVAVPFGGGPIYVVAGAVFGFWKGLLITAIGDVLGFLAAFYLSRFFGRSIISFFVPSPQLLLVDKILEHGSRPAAFLKARLAFLGFPEIFAYAAGLTRVPVALFLIVQMLPHTLGVSLIVLFGDVLLTDSPLFLVAVTVIAVLAALAGGWWFHRDITKTA